MKLVAPTEKDIILPAIWTSAAVEVQYRKRLQALVDEMCGSTLYWITAAWKKGPPVSTLAEDADPVAVLRATLEQLQEHWSNRIDDVAVGIAEGFAQSSMRYSDTAFHAALKKAGFTVPFTLTEGMEEAF
ncbi:MAG: hypothetical protein LBK01_00005, partial [Burkholderiaceae bacterium]|nr:hypothetical protein [Burkholderiaceae bacterium]